MQRRSLLLMVFLFPASLAAESAERIHALGGRASQNASGQVVDVNLRGSWVNDADMIELGRFPELQRLDLSHTRITDEGLLRLKSAAKIVDLNLFYVEQITDQGMTAIKNWTNLKRLNVRGTRISDGTLEILSRMPQLEALDIANTQISDDGYDYLITLVNLKELSLGRSRLSDNAIKALRLLPTLTYLDLGGPGKRSKRAMSDETVSAIAELQDLVTLKLGHSNISNHGVEILSRLGNVKKLSLAGCRTIGDPSVAAIKGWKSLQYLDLQDTAMTEAAIDSIRLARPDMKILANPGAEDPPSEPENESR
jgi:Leucine-rich repeat (LRR) protein